MQAWGMSTVISGRKLTEEHVEGHRKWHLQIV